MMKKKKGYRNGGKIKGMMNGRKNESQRNEKWRKDEVQNDEKGGAKK